MKPICAIFLLFLCANSHAKLNVMQSLYMADVPARDSESSEDFKMTGELGVLLASGNRNGTTLKGKVNATHNMRKWNNQYVANFLYKQNERDVDGEEQRVTSAQKVFVSAQSDYKLKNPKRRLFMYGEYEDDRFNRYDYQAALAVGWSEQVWDNEVSEFRYSVGPGYAMSKFNDPAQGQDQMGMIVRAAVEYERKLSDRATFKQFLSTEADSDFSRSVSETSLAAKINGSLAMKLSVNMIHNKSPDNVGKSLDTETAVTLVYQFF